MCIVHLLDKYNKILQSAQYISSRLKRKKNFSTETNLPNTV